ncbi:TetR/AcrR family transcriptional regulator [Streptomyces sp. NPDC004111]|uniref:TetR/AcrR family transcriptional regulator n=1 Tax=Streptomyces sp. NPDC004111 TaxID=3364690 RepID=UPI0036744CBA
MTPEPQSERRSERARRAILDAVFELAVGKGYAKLTIEAIASRAGVGKPTIYRWWSCKGAVALDSLNERIGDGIAFPDTGDIAADLKTQLTAVTELLTGDVGRVFRGIIGEAQNDPELMETVRETVVDPRIRECRARLDSAVAAGQVRADLPTSVMVDLFYAPVYYRFLLGFDAAAVRRCPELVEEVLLGLRPRTPHM